MPAGRGRQHQVGEAHEGAVLLHQHGFRPLDPGAGRADRAAVPTERHEAMPFTDAEAAPADGSNE